MVSWTRRPVIHRLTNEQEQLLAKASKRVTKIGTHELLELADAYGSGMAAGFMDYRKHGDKQSIDEISDGLLALQAIVGELTLRAEG